LRENPVTRPRYDIAGVRDYTGVALNEIVSDIGWLFNETTTLVSKLHGVEQVVKKNARRLDDPKDILEVVRYHISLFEDYARDLKRLINELPKGVEERHIRIVEGITTSAVRHNGGMILQFKLDHISRDLKDESLRHLLDDIYGSIRQHIVNVIVGCAFKDQLSTFIGEKLSTASKVEKAKPLQDIKVRLEPLAVSQGTKWSDILIRFMGNEEIEIHAGRKALGVHTYARCGFLDQRSRKPNKQWIILRCLAAKGGVLDTSDIGSLYQSEMKNIKKGISVLRHNLRNLFKIHGDPISKYSRKTRSWKTQFLICTAIIGGNRDSKPDVKVREDIAQLLKEQQAEYSEEIKKDFVKEVRGRGRYGGSNDF